MEQKREWRPDGGLWTQQQVRSTSRIGPKWLYCAKCRLAVDLLLAIDYHWRFLDRDCGYNVGGTAHYHPAEEDQARPQANGKGHDFNTGEQGLSFLGLTIVPVIAFCFYQPQERYHLRDVAQNDGKRVPEAGLWMARVGAIFIPVNLFWFGWRTIPPFIG